MMNSDTLLCYLQQAVLATRVKQVHVVPKDFLSRISFTQFPSVVCFNTDESWLPGKHFILLWVDYDYRKKKIYAKMFDSYGKTYSYYRGPPLPVEIRMGNTCELQQEKSEICSLYTIYFAYYLSRNYSVRKILKRFVCHSSLHNDKLVYKFFCRRIRIKSARLKCNDNSQVCRPKI